MTSEQQLILWVDGTSVHNVERDECCPDFSCCRPALLASKDERVAFQAGSRPIRDIMLGEFLSRLLKHEGMKKPRPRGADWGA